MIFLNPLVLFGLLAAAIPVLIHLLNLRKLKRIEFSTLAFLKELQKNKIRKLKLKQWLLLALRVLIIIALVMAFARPTLKGVAIGGTTSAAKTTAVFILDNTYSMSAVTSEGSYFNISKEIAEILIHNLQEGDQAALITVSSSDDKNETFITGSPAEFKRRLKETVISYKSGTLNNAIIRAAEVIGESDDFNKEIYILSDLQKSRLNEQNSVSDLGELLTSNVKVYTFRFPDKDIINLSVSDLKLNTSIFERSKPVSFDVTVRNNSTVPINNGVVSLFINGERSAQQSFSLEGSREKTLTLESGMKTSGFIDVSAELEDDDILQDNRRFLTFRIPGKINIGIFAEKTNDVKFLQTALAAYGEESPLDIRLMELNRFSSMDPGQFSVIIICGGRKFNGIERLNSYLQNGGGLLLFPGENTSPEEFNSMLQSLNLPSVEGSTGLIKQTRSLLRFETVQLEHILFNEIFSGKKEKIESPEIYYSFEVNPVIKGTPLISLNNGSAFITEARSGSGKILLFNTAPVLSWSTFPVKSIFPPIINRSVLYLASSVNIQNPLIAGENINLFTGRAIKEKIRLKHPDNTEEFLTVPEDRSGYIELKNTKTAGIYKYLTDKDTIQQVSVNTNPLESQMEHLEIEQMEEYLEDLNFKGSFFTIPAGDDPGEVIRQARFGSELWKYFLFAALALAVAEMTLARNSKKDLVEDTKV